VGFRVTIKSLIKWIPVCTGMTLQAIFVLIVFSTLVFAEENVVLPEQNISVVNIKVLKEATKENGLQKIITYRAVIKDQAGNLASGAQISFEAYSDSANKYSIVKAKEVGPGDYVAELSLVKNTNWSITVLGVWDSYPFRVNFNEVFIKPSENIAKNQETPELEKKENKTQDIYKPKSKEKKTSPRRQKLTGIFNIIAAVAVIILVIIGIAGRKIKK